MNILSKILQHNWIAILYFNFKMLPLRQAIHLPFDFYHSVRFNDLSGKIVLQTSLVRRGVVKIGGRGSDIFPRRETVVSIAGTISFGNRVEIGNGASIVVCKDAVCTLNDSVRLGAGLKLYCEKRIIICKEVDVSWESQVFDTDFHYMEDVVAKKVSDRVDEIVIGAYNWIGNRVNIMKGCRTPDNTIVASNSLINKDYTDIAEYSILAGTPAKVVSVGKRRLFQDEEDKYIRSCHENSSHTNLS